MNEPTKYSVVHIPVDHPDIGEAALAAFRENKNSFVFLELKPSDEEARAMHTKRILDAMRQHQGRRP